MFSILFTIIVISSTGSVAVSTQLIGKYDTVETCALQQRRLLGAALVGSTGAARYQTAQCVFTTEFPDKNIRK